MPQQRNLLGNGLTLALRAWPALVWTYVFNLGLALVFTMPLHSQIDAITAHSLASQRLAAGFDLGVLGGVVTKLYEGPGPDMRTSYFGSLFYFAIYFLVVPGALVCYQTGSSARISALLHSGFVHFWRFVRLTLITVIIGGIVLAGLMALQNLWTDHLDQHTPGRPGFLLQRAGLIVVGLVAALLRVYFDLMQVYTVQLGLQAPEIGVKRSRQVRRTFGPAWRALVHNFFRVYLAFVLLAVLGLASVFVTARTAMHSLAQPRVWPLFLLAQVGLFVMLFTRFWQRGAETILALDNPIPLPPVVVPEPPMPEPQISEPPTQDLPIPDPDGAYPEPAPFEEPPLSEVPPEEAAHSPEAEVHLAPPAEPEREAPIDPPAEQHEERPD